MHDALSEITEIVRDLLIFVGVMTALLVALLVIVARLPDENPLKRILTALSYRMGATAAAGALAIPVEPIPGLDALYDIGVPIALIIYWITFFKSFFGSKPKTVAPETVTPAPPRGLPPGKRKA
ncbi:MAG TPA: hypothetical protein VGG12_05000 [Methylovirgula sp.]